MAEILQRLTSDEKFFIKKVSSGKSPLLTSKYKLTQNYIIYYLVQVLPIIIYTLKGSSFLLHDLQKDTFMHRSLLAMNLIQRLYSYLTIFLLLA